MAPRKHTSFPKLVDKQQITHHHINNIESVVNDLQADNIHSNERNFLDDCLFVLNHNPYINAMDYIDFSNTNEIQNGVGSGFSINVPERCAVVNANINSAIIYTVPYSSEYNGMLNSFLLKTDADIPRGCSIKYYIGQDINSLFPIVDGEGQPRVFATGWSQVLFKIEMTKNSNNETPRLFEMGLLYEDSKIKHEIVDIMSDIDDMIETTDTLHLHYADASHERVVKITTDKGITTDIIYTQDKPTRIERDNGRGKTISDITYNSDGSVDTVSKRYE